MTAYEIWFGMWFKILKTFWPVVIALIVGLTYLWIGERKVENDERNNL